MFRSNSSRHPPEVYHSQDFTESCGTILVDKVTRTICLLEERSTRFLVLPKGRRDTFESRQAAALRETREESGYACRLAAIELPTRTTAPGGNPDAPDRSRVVRGTGEPFTMLAIPRPAGRVKLVWYFLAETTREYDGRGLDGKAYFGPCQEVGEGERRYEAKWYDWREAEQVVTSEEDAEVVKRAGELMEQSWGWGVDEGEVEMVEWAGEDTMGGPGRG